MVKGQIVNFARPQAERLLKHQKTGASPTPLKKARSYLPTFQHSLTPKTLRRSA
jgi:hypothetical protein